MTEMCKAVNIPALQDHNSLKAPGCDHTGRCEAHSNPFLPNIADSNRYVSALQYMDSKKYPPPKKNSAKWQQCLMHI